MYVRTCVQSVTELWAVTRLCTGAAPPPSHCTAIRPPQQPPIGLARVRAARSAISRVCKLRWLPDGYTQCVNQSLSLNEILLLSLFTIGAPMTHTYVVIAAECSFSNNVNTYLCWDKTTKKNEGVGLNETVHPPNMRF